MCPLGPESEQITVCFYRTLELAKIIKDIKASKNKNIDNKNLEDFLNSVPGCSNYLTKFDLNKKNPGKVFEILKENQISTIKIRDHILTSGLTDECKLGLLPSQCGILDSLIQQSTK